jgi:hypothetical protein
MKTLKSIVGVGIVCLVACSPHILMKFAMSLHGMGANANVVPLVVAAEKPVIKRQARSVEIAVVNASTRPR